MSTRVRLEIDEKLPKPELSLLEKVLGFNNSKLLSALKNKYILFQVIQDMVDRTEAEFPDIPLEFEIWLEEGWGCGEYLTGVSLCVRMDKYPENIIGIIEGIRERYYDIFNKWNGDIRFHTDYQSPRKGLLGKEEKQWLK